MEIKITIKDEENDIDWHRTALGSFDIAAMNLWSLERAYKKELEKIEQLKEEDDE